MSNIIGLCGLSGSGKSSSLKYLDPKETFIISCTPKQLSIPGFRKNYKKLTKTDKGYQGNWYFSNKFESVNQILQLVDKTMPHIKTLVIDDANYLLTEATMSRALEKGYDKFTETAKKYYDMCIFAMTLREDLNVVFISHIHNYGTDLDPNWKIWTTGKLLDNSVNVDGLFNYIIYSEKIASNDNVEFKFRTKTLGPDTCKSTYGCFEELFIEPNMKLVIDTINKFENGRE